ncbi:MAG: O-antigen/teichoic acid export membrane protein [Alteromonadaceae bacterium]|jgi:O-antigen/teichoic acid export membrane protein
MFKRLGVMLSGLQQYYANLSSSFVTYLLGAVVNLTATYAMMVLLINVLAKEDYAQYGVYISLFSLLLIFFNFGHKEVVFKYASASRADSTLSPLPVLFIGFYRWNLLLLALVQVLIVFDTTLYAGAMMFLVNSWMVTLAAYHRGSTDYKKDAWALPLQRLLWLSFSLSCYFTFDSLGLITLFFCGLLATSLCIVWLYWPLRRVESVKFNGAALLSNPLKTGQMKLLLSYLVVEISSVFYLKSDVLLLRFFDLDMTVIADYFFAIQVFEIAVLVLMPIGYFYLNRLNLVEPEQRSHVSILPMLMVLLTLLVLMHGGFAWLAPMVFPYAAPKYVESINVVLWVMCSLYPVAVNILLSSQLIVANKERTYAKICFIALLFNLIANSVLIPSMGLTAVMAVKFLTELLIMLLLLLVCRSTAMNQSNKSTLVS